MSVPANEVANGWTVGSSLYVPSSKPKSRRIPAEELLLRGEREVAFEERVVRRLAGVAHDGGQLGPEHVEDRLHLCGRHPGLVFVEERVVGRVALLHQLGPPERDVVHPLQRRQEHREVILLARLEPRDVRLAALTRPRGCDLGRNASCLLPLPARDADEARVVRVVAELRLERGDLVEQSPDLVRDEALVDDTGERCRGLRPGGCALRRHHRALVPAQHPEGALEVVELRQALLQIRKSLVHQQQTYLPLGSARCLTC